MNNYELCVNLWYYVDIKTRLVSAIAGRGYYLQGNDAAKTLQLKKLAGKDFLLVTWLPIPAAVTTHIVNDNTGETLTFKRTIHATDIDTLGLDLFSDVFQQIESTVQNFQPIKQAGKNTVANELLYVMTAVHVDENNRLVVME